MADLTYAWHSIPSPKPTKKTVKGLILRTLTHKDWKNGKKTTTIAFWEMESRWWRGGWLRRPTELKFKLMVGEAQKQPDLPCKTSRRLRNWQQEAPPKAATQLKHRADLLTVSLAGSPFHPPGRGWRLTPGETEQKDPRQVSTVHHWGQGSFRENGEICWKVHILYGENPNLLPLLGSQNMDSPACDPGLNIE